MTEPDSYEIAMKLAQKEDDLFQRMYPGEDPNDIKGEWVIFETNEGKNVSPFFMDHSHTLVMISTLVIIRKIPRKDIQIFHGTRAMWKMEGVE